MSFICPEFERGRAVVIAGKERVIVQVDPGDYMMRFIRTGEASAA